MNYLLQVVRAFLQLLNLLLNLGNVLHMLVPQLNEELSGLRIRDLQHVFVVKQLMCHFRLENIVQFIELIHG
ncbi:hypothetical protein P4S95_28170 [Aneurinibacillus aneurinilyticus]|uniref:hypothetical protein n=1 Tax=Aneurinibacillus aneurinilyticus TaxID=1391 RepID=UPI002E210332|nr:hypothetical protein [Aneurinibacillus aneurinilyticus]